MNDGADGLEGLQALVLDPQPSSRMIAMEILRAGGVRDMAFVETGLEAMTALKLQQFDIIVMDWIERPMEALDFLRTLRRDESNPNRATPLVLLTNRARQRDVEAARAAGADAFLTKPISIRSALQKMRAVLTRPQPFIVTATYAGPCRRRRDSADYTGPRRRLGDAADQALVAAEAELRQLTLRRAHAAVLLDRASRLTPGDVQAARLVRAAAVDVQQIAEQIGDPILGAGVRHMLRYLDSVGATDALEPDVLRTHAEALHQLAELPNAKEDTRRDVAASLQRMVDKKLRQARA